MLKVLPKKLTIFTFVTVGVIASGGVAVAQDAQGSSLAFPGVFGAASAVPAPGGTGYIAATISNPRGGVSGADADGDISMGYTVGNPFDAASLTFGVNLNSLTDSFGDSGNFNLSLSRNVGIGANSATFIGTSVGQLGGWGDGANADETYSVYISHLTTLGPQEIPFQATVGYGNQSTYSTDGLGTLEEGFFYGFGVGVSQTVSFSLSGTETQVNVGGSVTIPSLAGVSLSAGVYDVTDNADRQQYSLTIGYSF